MHHQPNLCTLRPLALMFVINILSVLIEQMKETLLKTCRPCRGYWPEKAKIQSPMEPLIYTQIRKGKNKSKEVEREGKITGQYATQGTWKYEDGKEKKKSNQTS